MNTAQVIKVQQIRFTKKPDVAGSQIIAYNMDVDGKPFGQVWKCKGTKTETMFRWNISLVTDDRIGVAATRPTFDTAEAAMDFARGLA